MTFCTAKALSLADWSLAFFPFIAFLSLDFLSPSFFSPSLASVVDSNFFFLDWGSPLAGDLACTFPPLPDGFFSVFPSLPFLVLSEGVLPPLVFSPALSEAFFSAGLVLALSEGFFSPAAEGFFFSRSLGFIRGFLFSSGRSFFFQQESWLYPRVSFLQRQGQTFQREPWFYQRVSFQQVVFFQHQQILF